MSSDPLTQHDVGAAGAVVADMHVFAREALALGYDAIEIAHSTAAGSFERLHPI